MTAFPSLYSRSAILFSDNSKLSIFASDGLGVIFTSVTSPILNSSFPHSADIEFNSDGDPSHIKIIRDVANTIEHITVFLILYGRNFLDTTQYINAGIAGIHKKEYTTSAIEMHYQQCNNTKASTTTLIRCFTLLFSPCFL